MRRHRLTGLAASAVLLVGAVPLAGCRPSVSGPPSVRFGQEACAQCRMIISDERFAAALTTEAGETAKFDDVGCMVEHEAAGFQASTAYWVHEFKADAWLDAREATFVRSKSVTSPMGFGIAAVRTPPAAGEFGGDPQPRISRFDGLPGLIASGRDDGPSDSKP